MGVLYGAMYVCEHCGKREFFKKGETVQSWRFKDRQILCDKCYNILLATPPEQRSEEVTV